MSLLFCTIFFLSLFPFLADAFSGGQWAILATHSSDNWAADQRHQPKCLDIPVNFTLCHGMQYKTMRLPNLLEHETLDEAIQQGSAWVSLLHLHCHPHTKLFLCSLFAPICLLPQLDKPIQPCQSLCRHVQQGCEPRMAIYGFPWPEMLNCSQFPSDNNDLCMPPPYEGSEVKETNHQLCKSCAQVATFENLMDNFCRSSIVLKVRLRPFNSTHMTILRKLREFKSISNLASANSRSAEAAVRRKSRRHLGVQSQFVRLAEHGEGRCQCPVANINEPKTYLVMASERRRGGDATLNAKLLTGWKFDKAFKAAIKRFKRLDCSMLGREIREAALGQMFRRRVTVS